MIVEEVKNDVFAVETNDLAVQGIVIGNTTTFNSIYASANVVVIDL